MDEDLTVFAMPSFALLLPTAAPVASPSADPPLSVDNTPTDTEEQEARNTAVQRHKQETLAGKHGVTNHQRR
jgi:hypothetical protein